MTEIDTAAIRAAWDASFEEGRAIHALCDSLDAVWVDLNAEYARNEQHAAEIDRLNVLLDRVEAERDAYRKAKQENDERFQLEAGTQKERAEQAEAALAECQYRRNVAEAAVERVRDLCEAGILFGDGTLTIGEVLVALDVPGQGAEQDE